MQLQVTVQDGQIGVGNARDHVELHPLALKEAAA